MKRPSFSLSKKALLAVSLIFLPVFVSFLHGYNNNRKILERHVLDDLRLNSATIKGRVLQFVETTQRRNADFASDGMIIERVERLAGGERSEGEALQNYFLKNKLPLDPFIRSIELISNDGRVLASTDGVSAGSSVAREAFFLNFRAGTPVTEVLIDSEKGVPGLAVSSGVISLKTGEPVAIITRFVLLSELDSVLKTAFSGNGAGPSGPPPLETIEAYLVNRDGLMITGSRFVKDSVLRKTVRSRPVAACLDSGADFSGTYPDYRGVEVVGSSRCIRPLNWTLLVEIGSDEALAGAVSMRNDALAAAATVVMLVALLFAAFYKNVVLQIRRLSGAAASFSGGDYDASLPVDSDDELGVLSEAFNAMASEIKSREERIRNSEARYSTMLQTASDAIVTIDSEESVTGFNAAAEKMFGYACGEVLGKNVEVLMPERYRARHHDAVAKVKQSRRTTVGGKTREYEAVRKDGTEFPISLTMSPAEVEGRLTFLAIIRDITESRKADESLRANERFLKSAQQIAHLGSWDWDIVNDTLIWSDEIYRIFGLPKEEFGATYEAFLNSVHPDDRSFVIESVDAALYRKKPYSIDHRIVLPDGKVRVVHEQADVTFDPFGAATRMVGTVQDITERKLAEYELKKLSMAIEQSVNIVFITDISGVIEYVNPVFEKVTGYAKYEALGKTPRILSSSEVPRHKYTELWTTILAGKTWRDVLKNRKKDGGFFWVNAAISPIKNEKGEITHFLSVQEDITEKMASEERIRYLASNDELTGLLNRTRFIDLLDDWIRYAASSGSAGALCFIDIDQFKVLNDSLGHGVGDEFLRRIARLFNTVVELSYRKTFPHEEGRPLLSRLSGDEFAVFLPSADAAAGLAVMEELRQAVQTFHFTEHGTSSSISVGVALFPEHGSGARELFSRADAAMYRAKELGRNRCYLFRPEDRDLEKMHLRLNWKDKILKALREDRFEPWFQPILDLSDDTIRHYEVLARMRDTDGTVLAPGSFIDTAERFGLVGLIDRRVIDKAMEIQAEMKSQGKDLSFSLNLSGRDLNDEDLMAYIKNRITVTGADPARIIFEITETAAISDLERAIRFIKALKALGCRFALDDFGVGFTSFTYLKEMQVDYIKIDGSFIRKLHENPNDQVFVKAITDVARGLKIKSVAEFVETAESLDLLRKFKVDYAQGYLIGKPGPALAARLGHDLRKVKDKSPVIKAISGGD